MGLLKTVVNWFTGKSDDDEELKKANRSSYYSGRSNGNSTAAEVRQSIRKAEEKSSRSSSSSSSSSTSKSEPPQASQSPTTSSAFKATTRKLKKAAETAEEIAETARGTKSSAFKATPPPTIKHHSTALGTLSTKENNAFVARKALAEADKTMRNYQASKLAPSVYEKYGGETQESKIARKQGEWAYDPEVAKYDVLKHPVAESLGRGMTSGATFGLSELAAAKLPRNNGMEEAEETYQKNKNKLAEFAGEMAGSLGGFGLTSDVSKAALKKVAPKLTAKMGVGATERLATNKLVMDAARKEAERTIGLAATEAQIADLAKKKAAKVVAALGEDAAINLTTGLTSDVAHAIIDSDNPAEFLKNMALNAPLNLGLGLVTSAAPALRGNAVEDAAEKAASKAIRNEAEEQVDDVLNRAVKEVEPTVTKMEAEPKVEAEPTKTRINEAGETVTEREVADEIPIEKQAREAEKKVQDAVNNEQIERNRNAEEIRKASRDYDKEIREATNGEFGERKGVVTTGKSSNPKEQKRALAQMGRDADVILNDNGAIENADALETAYRTWNAPRKASAMKKSYAKASEGVNNIADSIKAKLEAFIKNPDSGTNLTIDDVFDMIAVKQVYKDNGMEMPEDLQAAFNRLLNANKTEHAQGLSVIEQALREYDPDYRRAFIRKDFDKFLSRFGNVDSWDEVAESLDRNHKTSGYLQDKLQELVDFKVGEDGTIDEYKKLYKDLQNEILRNAKPSLWNMLDSLRHSFMLSNFATAARNIYGNASQRIMYNISDLLTAQFENSLERRIARNPELAKKYGDGFERTTKAIINSKDNRKFAHAFTEGKLGSLNKNPLKGAADEGYLETLSNAAKEDVTDVMGYEKLLPHLEKGADYAAKSAGERVATGAYKLSQAGGKVVSFMLNEPDSWFVERNYRSALAKYLEANGITDMKSLKGKEEVFQRARQHAKDVALENTYKKANRVTTFIERARAAGKKKGASPLAMAGSIALDAELPYVKVPVNMFINNVKYSPVGIATNGLKAVKAANIGDVEGLQKAVRELSKGVTGTGLAALGFMLNCDENEQMDADSIGVISKAAEHLKEYGVRDNSVKIGDYNFNIADIGLGATQFLMGAAYADALNEYGGAPKTLLEDANAVLDAFKSTFDVVGDLSLMDNFMQTIDAFSQSNGNDTKLSERVENASMQILPNYVNQYLPNPLRAVAKGTTEADLDTGTKKGKDVTKLEKTLKRNINNQIQGIPVVNEKVLPHKVDTHGRLVSTGLFPEGRDTGKKKAIQSLVNYADPLSTRKISIPDVDKEEMSVKRTGESNEGEPFKPKGFDPDRKYEAKIGTGKDAEVVKLTGKEREQVARSAQNSGYDGASNLVRKGMFGDRLGDRAQEILKNIPDDEAEARKFIFSTPEWKNADNAQREAWLKAWYGEGETTKGVNRTRNAEAYINVAGNSEGDFRFENDLTKSWKEKYDKYGIGDTGIDKGTFVDIFEDLTDAHHKYKDGKNIETINTKGKTIAALLANGALTAEQRVAIYNAVRGNNKWKDWDGESAVSNGYYRRGYYRRWRNWGYSRKGRASTMDKAAFKGEKINTSSESKATSTSASSKTPTYKSLAKSLKTTSNNTSSPDYNTASVKYQTAKAVKSTPKKKTTAKKTPPKVKFKKYEV